MDAYITRTQSRSRSPSPVRKGVAIYVGILGQRNDMSMNEIQENIIQPLVQQWGRLPDKVLCGTEGKSSMFLSHFFETKDVDTQSIACDWKRDGKRARIMRDQRIIQEATHLICIKGPRSQYYETLGSRLIKKKEEVFLLEYQDKSLCQLSL